MAFNPKSPEVVELMRAKSRAQAEKPGHLGIVYRTANPTQHYTGADALTYEGQLPLLDPNWLTDDGLLDSPTAWIPIYTPFRNGAPKASPGPSQDDGRLTKLKKALEGGAATQGNFYKEIFSK